MANWWGTRSSVSSRLVWEVEAMKATFGRTFRLVVPKDNKELLHWLGDVEINMSILKQREHRIRIVYPANYPARPAEAYIVSPYIYSEKHQYEDGQLCLFNPRDGERYGWNPSKSTAVTVAGWAVQWLYAYYTWRATGDWPGIEEQITPPPPGSNRGRR
jgi:ubiquitin-protein ligase